MNDIADLLEREAARVAPSPGLARTLARARRRDRRRRLSALVIGVVIAAAGTAVALRAFAPRPAPDRQPASSVETGGYTFENIEVSTYPQHGGRNWVRITFDLSWPENAFPGVHRCSFRMVSETGATLGEFPSDLFRGRTRGPNFRAFRTRDGRLGDPQISCDAARLDVPGIAVLPKPYPPSLLRKGIDAVWAEIRSRVRRWAREFDAARLSVDQKAASMLAINDAIAELRVPQDTWRIQELSRREGFLCLRLPPSHEFRGGEFCD